ncbi:TPA: hypothetical protein NVL56_004344 [Enterobacter hormaechei subsp. xiangfangensis]|nr:hypothetical protein [Enterobacter hormaechei subsp. xiangfangensis]
MSHTFQQVIFGLKLIHEELWFSTKSDLDELSQCDKWRGSEICSTGGRPLAMQVGHPDEWEYTILYQEPDTGMIIDEPDEDTAVSDAFLEDVRFWMTTLVHPYIDDNGFFLPEDEGSGDCYSG